MIVNGYYNMKKINLKVYFLAVFILLGIVIYCFLNKDKLRYQLFQGKYMYSTVFLVGDSESNKELKGDLFLLDTFTGNCWKYSEANTISDSLVTSYQVWERIVNFQEGRKTLKRNLNNKELMSIADLISLNFKNKLKFLHYSVSLFYDVGNFDEFKQKMLIPEKRRIIYDALSENYDLGDFDSFEKIITSKDYGLDDLNLFLKKNTLQTI